MSSAPPPERFSWWALGVGALVIAVSGLACFLLVWTAPEAGSREQTASPRIVKTVAVEPRDERITVSAFGNVIPARQVVVRPQVQGRVVRQHAALVVGGYVARGEELIGIDPSDYELALIEAQTRLEEAKFDLEVERGRQVVASREWKLLEGDLEESETNRALVLREPHLRRAQAGLERAHNQIARANLDLSRTSIVLPFNAMVLAESVEEGQLVDRGLPIATLVGTDEFWVQVSVPMDKLRWIELPAEGREGATAEVFLETGSGAATRREGRVVRLLSDLGAAGRMARVLVRVDDPLGLEETTPGLPLLLGSYARVEIEAGLLENVVSISRSALHEGNRIWIVDENQRLQIRETRVLWARKDTVVISDAFQAGDQLIVSDLRVAVPGMVVAPSPVDPPDSEAGDGR